MNLSMDYKKLFRNLSRLIMGFVFLFSGFTKVVDPMGFQYKIDEFFIAFGTEWLSPLSLAGGIIIPVTEFATGFCLLANALIPLASIITLLFMSFFGVLTFILAIFNPVSDCGCFGDAIILTNWETFIKNVILIIPTIFIFLERKKFKSNGNFVIQTVQTAFIYCVGFFTSFYSLYNLPIVDYRPYRIGQNIVLASKEHPKGAPNVEFETSLIYEKDGKQEKFDIYNLPDSTWQWVETVNVQKSKGYTPKISNFYFSNEYSDNITNFTLLQNEMTLIAFIKSVEDLNAEQIQFYSHIYIQCLTNNMNFIMLTSSTNDKIHNFELNHLVPYRIYNIDLTVLKTIIRADEGIMLTYKGTILKKWNAEKFVSISELNEYKMINEAVNSYGHSPLKQTMWYMLLFISLALFFDWMFLKSGQIIRKK